MIFLVKYVKIWDIVDSNLSVQLINTFYLGALLTSFPICFFALKLRLPGAVGAPTFERMLVVRSIVLDKKTNKLFSDNLNENNRIFSC